MSQSQHLHLLFTEARMAGLVDSLDELHSAASEGRLHEATTLSDAELVGWLIELVYTATETMAEIRRQQAVVSPAALHLVVKSEAS